jgi:hypothetical protein
LQQPWWLPWFFLPASRLPASRNLPILHLLDQIRVDEKGERFMAMMNDLKHIFIELNNSDELAGINTLNITENLVFQDLFEQLTYIRQYILIPSGQ